MCSNLVVGAKKTANYSATSLLSCDLASFLGPVLFLSLPLFFSHFLFDLFTLLVYKLIADTHTCVFMCICNIYIYYLSLFFKAGFQDKSHDTILSAFLCDGQMFS